MTPDPGASSPAAAPAVTVGIPFFNNEGTLADAIRSVFAQTFPDWELILVDDGSRDRSLSIARSVADPRVRVLSDGRNRNLAARLNEIARLARAPLLARMDADDLMHPERLGRQVCFLRENPAVDVAGAGAWSIDGDGRIRGKRETGLLDLSPLSVLLRGLFVHPTIAGRRDWFLAHPYEESEVTARCQDYELWLRTFRASRFAVLPEPLLFYREDVKGLLLRYRTAMRQHRGLLARGRDYGFSRPQLAAGLAARWAKTARFELLWAIGARERMLARRNLPLSSEELGRAERVLRSVRSTPVPGLDEAAP